MKHVLVTGASRGIGLALTRVYLERGDRVFATCRRPRGNHALDDLRARHVGKLEVLAVDVTDEASIRSAAEAVGGSTIQIDVLVNNAGVFHPSVGLADVDLARLMESFAVNSAGPLIVSRAFLRFLRDGSAPRIVNLTMPTRPIARLERTANHAYVASRYATNALTRMMALELRTHGVIVVALWPGYLRTDMNAMAAEARDPVAALPAVLGLVDQLTIEDSGTCLMPDGSRFEW